MTKSTIDTTPGDTRHDWNWDRDGALEDAHYVETREVVVKTGPSAGRTKAVFDFHHGMDDRPVSVWETTVLRSKFREELRARGKSDFEAGERITITPLGMKQSGSGSGTYRDFAVSFEHAAPRKTTAELLAGDDEGADDDVIPY